MDAADERCMDELLAQLGDLTPSATPSRQPTGTPSGRLRSNSGHVFAAAPPASPASSRLNPLLTEKRAASFSDQQRPAWALSMAALDTSPDASLGRSSLPGNQRSSLPDALGGRGGSSRARPPEASKASTKLNMAHIDDLLEDLDVPVPQRQQQLMASTSECSSLGHSRHASLSGSGRGPKCAGGLFLGGRALPRGRNGATIGTVMCCDAMRCTKCDLDVIMFEDRAWGPDCEYLFFRNNYPDAHKLAACHAPQPGTCAYCCQCSWQSVGGSAPVRVDSYAGDLCWVCKGHGFGGSMR